MLLSQKNFDRIEAALDELPERFGSGMFYNPGTGRFCFYGWVGFRLGLSIQQLRNQEGWRLIEDMFDSESYLRLAVEADELIQTHSGDPALVRRDMLEKLKTQVEVSDDQL